MDEINIKREFCDWLTHVLPQQTPEQVVAYNFNIAECGDYIIEIVGASQYDPEDEDWACEEL